VYLVARDRLRHMQVSASPNKSIDFLARLALHDLEERYGIAVIDTQGTLIDKILPRLPAHRLGHVSILDHTKPYGRIPLGVLDERSGDNGTNALDFDKLLDGGVLLARLPAEEMGEDDAAMFSDILLGNLRRAMLASQPGQALERPPFI